ncbi:MAG TPA: hypothetical protein VMD30_10800 [Tepidisphaeraceae bacterium]|nr:hypothetical protein [Tepidisphaeraceae bacterium]
MKFVSLCALSILAFAVFGCETTHPVVAPYVAEESAADLTVNLAPPNAGGTFSNWWLIICPQKTQAGWFRISVGPDDQNVTQKIIWHAGDPLEFPLLHGHDLNKIYVVGYSGQDGKEVYFGICHNQQVCCRHFDFNQSEQTGGQAYLIDANDTDTWDCH